MLTMEHLSCWFSLNRGRGWTASGRTSCYPSSPFLSPIPHIWLVFPTTTCLSMFIASQPLWVNVYCQSTTLYRKLKESNPSEPNPVGQTASAAVSQPQSHQDLTVDAAPSSWWVQSTYCLIEDCDGRSKSLECSKNVQFCNTECRYTDVIRSAWLLLSLLLVWALFIQPSGPTTGLLHRMSALCPHWLSDLNGPKLLSLDLKMIERFPQDPQEHVTPKEAKNINITLLL